MYINYTHIYMYTYIHIHIHTQLGSECVGACVCSSARICDSNTFIKLFDIHLQAQV